MVRKTSRVGDCADSVVVEENQRVYGQAKAVYADALESIRAAGLEKTERLLLTPQGPSILVRESLSPVLNFCANNYLGLSSHPLVLEAARTAMVGDRRIGGSVSCIVPVHSPETSLAR